MMDEKKTYEDEKDLAKLTLGKHDQDAACVDKDLKSPEDKDDQKCDQPYYETNHWKWILDDNQDYLGRTIFVLKRKAKALSEVSQEEMKDLLLTIRLFEYAVKHSFGAEVFNWSCLLNDAYKEEIPMPQVHLDCRPRYRYDVVLADKRFVDKEFGHHYSKERPLMVDSELKQQIIDEISINLPDDACKLELKED